MAKQKLELTFTWENNASLELVSKLNDEPTTTVLEMHENTHLDACAHEIKALLLKYLTKEINGIIEQMKAP